MTKAEENVLTWALAWWRSKRPVDWTLDEHLAEPQVNTMNTAELELARACAAYTKRNPKD